MDPVLNQRVIAPARRRVRNNVMKTEMNLDHFQRNMGQLIDQRYDTYTSYNHPQFWVNTDWFDEYRRDMVRIGRRTADTRAQYLTARKELDHDVRLLRSLQGSRLANAADQNIFRKVRRLDLVYRLRKDGPYTRKLRRWRRKVRRLHPGSTPFTRLPTVEGSRKRGFSGVNYFLRADNHHDKNRWLNNYHEQMRFHEGRDIRRERVRSDPHMPRDRRIRIAAGMNPFPPLENPFFWRNDDRKTLGFLPKNKLPLAVDRFERKDNQIPPADYPKV